MLSDIMPGSVLKDKVFETGCNSWGEQHLPQLKTLVLKAGEDPLAGLKRLGWDGKSPIVSVLAGIDNETVRVTQSQYITGGQVFCFSGTARGFGNFKPPAAWKKGIKLSFAVKGEMLIWNGSDAGKNVTNWTPLRDLDAGVKFEAKDGTLLTGANLTAMGVDMDNWLGRMMLR